MPLLAIVDGTAILPDRLLPRAVIVCERGRIVSVKAAGRVPRGAEVVDARGAFVSPGFVDLHVHGGAGADVMDGTAAAVATACACHLRHGTTTIFPTTTTGSPDLIDAMLAACRAAAAPNFGGVHLYGPYFAAAKVGCHDQAGRRDPLPREYDRYFATGLVKIATCAAELPGAEAFYRAARRRRCLVTCGHSDASWTEMERAFAAGMRHVDHFWCAMSSVPSLRARLGTPMQASMAEFVLATPAMSTEVLADGEHLAPDLLKFAAAMLGPRRLCLVTCGHSDATWTEMARAFAAGVRHVDHFWCAMSSVPSIRARCGTPMQASMAEFVLATPEMSTEVLADGHHLAPDLLRCAAAMLGPRRLCLVSDASRAVDMPPGRYRFGHEREGTWFESDGLVGRAGAGLASSVVGMDHMVRHFHRATGAALHDVIRMASLTPAELAGIGRKTGSLEPGKRADLLVLSRELDVRRVFVRGREET
ncbi:MAG: N-acetylglucosamine-6-phosphate deacetylase [Planctomycetia bacterium]